VNELAPLTPEQAERTIGITTTVPVEIILAAGLIPVDLNNRFINSGIAAALVDEAENRGFPRSFCAWTKGVYAAARRLGVRRVAAVVQGDCSNTQAMAEVLQVDGVRVAPFAFPYRPGDAAQLDLALDCFAHEIGADRAVAEEWKIRLDKIRKLAHQVDRLTWKKNQATGAEQHYWTISCSDFNSDTAAYERDCRQFIRQAEQRAPLPHGLRLALVGVPPICGDLFSFLEEHRARVVFNEVPRQFAMPADTSTLREQYSRYTYPYDIFYRLADIAEQIAVRKIDGVIHYVQSFCHRQVQDAIMRDQLHTPILALEGDRPAALDPRSETRIEAFLEMLKETTPHSPARTN